MALSQASADAINSSIQVLQDQKNGLLSDIQNKQASIDNFTADQTFLQEKISIIKSNIDGIQKDQANMQAQADGIDVSILAMTQDLKDGGF